ncbi:MAG: NusA-like transcription termination signal-binding factor [Candidatus Woesearchaeota archaeon]
MIFDQAIIGVINEFEKVTRAKVKDCFLEDGELVIVIMPGMMGLAVGTGGANIKRFSAMARKKINLIEFRNDPREFVEKLVYPVRPKEVRLEDDAVVVVAATMVEKGKIFGREKTNLKRIQKLVSKYFKLDVRLE